MKTTTIEFEVGGIAFRIHTAEEAEAVTGKLATVKAKKKGKKRRSPAEMAEAGVESRAVKTSTGIGDRIKDRFKIGSD